MKALALGVLLAIAGALKAVVLRYKTELVAAAVVGSALFFASPLDRALIVAAIVVSFFVGYKLGRPPAIPSSS